MLVAPDQLRHFIGNIHLFGKLDDEQLDQVVSVVEPRLYEQGKQIYEAGSDATVFYILYSGEVQIQRLVEDQPDFIENFEPGDYFGQEAIGGEYYRQSNAMAVEDAIVLEITSDNLAELEHNIPVLAWRLRLIQRSFTLTWQIPIKWREPSEVIFYATRRHVIYLVLRMIFPAILLLAGLLTAVIGEMVFRIVTPVVIGAILMIIGAAVTLWQLVDWSNDYFIVTDRRVIALERIILFFDSRTEAPMEAILSVTHGTDLLGRWLNYGTINVKSFTGTVRFDGVEGPREVQALIERILLRVKSRVKQEQRRTIDHTLRSRLRPEPAKPAAPPPPTPAEGEEEEEEQPAEYVPGLLQKMLSNVFYMRWEQNGVITYRKHWLVLLENIWVPTLILLANFILLIARFLNAYTFLSPVAALGLFFVIFLVVGVWWAYQYADWKNDIYVVTADQIIDVYKKPLGTETRKTAPIKNILSIEYRRIGFLGYLFNYGTVYIKVGETTFDFDFVYNPAEVSREIFKRYNEFKYREKKAQEEEEASRMADWIEGYNRLIGS